jgi:hypothetical protein
MHVTGGFIIGFDSDPENIFEAQVRFIRELSIPTAMIGLLHALPGTKLYQRLAKQGRLLTDSTGNNTDGTDLNFIPKIPMDKLIQGYRWVLANVYHPKNYFDRCLAVLQRFPKTRNNTGGRKLVSMYNILGLFNSILRQTFSSYGWQYLRYLVKAFRTNSRALVDIFTLAIQGHHFIKITKDVLKQKELPPVRSS